MKLIERTKVKLQKVFHDHKFTDIRRPHDDGLTLQYFLRSKEFLESSAVLEKEAPDQIMVRLHLQGQSIELAIKGFLLARKQETKKIHDLVRLTSQAESAGLKITQIEASSIVLINHYFYEDLSTNTKYKSRYPAKSQETSGGPIPDIKAINALYDSVLFQANQTCKFLDMIKHIE